MDGQGARSDGLAGPGTAGLLPRASVPARDPDAAARLAEALGHGPFALVALFISPEADLARLARSLPVAFGTTPLIGATTAGEIAADGYAEGTIVAVGFPASHFAAECLRIDLSAIAAEALAGDVIRARAALAARRPAWAQDFAFLLVDGLSVREDALTAALAVGLGGTTLFGGSAGDGTRFARTFVLADGAFRQDTAVLTLFRTACGVRVFSLDHLRPTDRRMVVTRADPARRIVHEINAEPAAREYARLLGKDPGQLTTFTFAAHPVVVRVGNQHHVRAIQRIDADGNLVFFSAIDEGLVLTLAEPQDMARHLDAALTELARDRAPAAILGCDCILRRIEAQEKQRFRAVSDILRRHGVTGFSTYGEQLNGMHVNQTMTGVAFYPPDAP
jgi:hypothetical protein